MKPTAEQIRHFFHYEPDTGELTWKNPLARVKPGQKAGWLWNGHRWYVKVSGVTYPVTHVIWCWMTGEWPDRLVDHEDTNGLNNRWKNLRLATRAQNNSNVALRADNTSGYKGVTWRAGNRSAGVRRSAQNGKRHSLGDFVTVLSAHSAYVRASIEWHGEFARFE